MAPGDDTEDVDSDAPETPEVRWLDEPEHEWNPPEATTEAGPEAPPTPSYGPPGPLPRGLAAAGTVVGLWWLALDLFGLWTSGYPLTGVAIAATTLPFFALLAWIAAAPQDLEERLHRWTPISLGAPGELGALILVAGTLVLILGIGSIVAAAYEWESITGFGSTLGDLTQLTPTSLVLNVALDTVVFLVPPMAWIAFVGHRDLRGILKNLGLRVPRERWGGSVILGVGITLAMLGLLAALAGAAAGLGAPIPPNPRAQDIASVLTLPTAILVAFLAALGEEVFFRGFLQPRVGLVAQAVLFSVAHLSYLNVLQLVVTFVMGIALGWARRHRGGLLAPMTAHFAFNFLQFAAVIAAGGVGP